MSMFDWFNRKDTPARPETVPLINAPFKALKSTTHEKEVIRKAFYTNALALIKLQGQSDKLPQFKTTKENLEHLLKLAYTTKDMSWADFRTTMTDSEYLSFKETRATYAHDILVKSDEEESKFSP
jgi:hypothetical protein